MLGKLIGSGYFSDVYEYGDKKVIKLMKDFVPLEDTMKECDILKAVHGQYPWSPEVYGLETVNGRHGVVMEEAEGLPISDIMIRTGSANMVQSIKLLADYHVKLHSIPDETLPPYEKVFESCLQKIDLPAKQKDFIRRYVKTLPHQSFMCHGDFHTDNMIKKNEKIMIVDWSSAYRGNPLSDAVNMQIIMRMPIKHHKIKFPVSVFAELSKKLIRGIYYKEYCRQTGATMEQINAWWLPAAVIRLGEGIPEECVSTLYDMIRKESERLGYSESTNTAAGTTEVP
jgi:aminoglycoside phosphotransferase (APT) family kinase protein